MVEFGDWCNGSTTDSGSVSLGSNPRSPVELKPCKTGSCKGFFFARAFQICETPTIVQHFGNWMARTITHYASAGPTLFWASAWAAGHRPDFLERPLAEPVVGVALPAGAEDALAGLAAGQFLTGLQVGEGLVACRPS